MDEQPIEVTPDTEEVVTEDVPATPEDVKIVDDNPDGDEEVSPEEEAPQEPKTDDAPSA